MENIGPAGSNSFESSPEDIDKPNIKKTKSSKKKLPILGGSDERAPDKKDKKEQTERDIAAVIDRFAWFDEKSPATKKTTPNTFKPDTEATPDDAEALEYNPEALTESETERLRQTIAQEHLEDMQSTDAPEKTELWPAIEFLRRVSEGADTEVAFTEAATSAGLPEPEIQEALHVTPAAKRRPEQPERPVVVAAPETSGQIDTDHEDEGEIDLGRTPPPETAPTAIRETVPPTLPDVLPDAAHNYYERRSHRGSLLAAGLAGYLVGRRRGRIKAEKKLKPVQRKLERQVTNLERDLTRKEQQLVAMTAVQTRAVERPLVERRAPLTVRVEKRPQLAVQPAERPVQPGRRETRLGLKKPEHAGRLGAVVLAVEAARVIRRPQKAEAPTPAKPVERPHNIRQAFDAEYVPTMQRSELLELSEKIVVEGASLRRIYESHLVGEKQLRHLVGEYLQGKDIRRQLRKEMVEHEIDFERDPILRDRVRSKVTGQQRGGGLQELLAKAGALPVDDKHSATIAAAESRRAAAEAKAAKRRHTADTAMITVIVVLALVVIGLLVR